jgi:hypothetical protein
MESFIKHLSIDTVERDTTGGPETHRSAKQNSATATGGGQERRLAGSRRRAAGEEPGTAETGVGGCPGGR